MSQTSTLAIPAAAPFEPASWPLVLAQEGVAPPAGASAPAPAADGSGGATGAAPAGGGGGDLFPILMLGFIVVLLMLTILGPRKEKKRRAEMMAALRKHDRVQTIGGVIGSIVEIKSDEIVLKVDESSNTRITFAKSAVQQVLESRERGREPDAEPIEAAEPDLARN